MEGPVVKARDSVKKARGLVILTKAHYPTITAGSVKTTQQPIYPHGMLYIYMYMYRSHRVYVHVDTTS